MDHGDKDEFDHERIEIEFRKNVRNQRLPQSRIIKKTHKIAPLITQMKMQIFGHKLTK